MIDRKPPKVDGSELETLTTLLGFQRESFVRKVSGIDEASARRRIVGSDTTLLWLTKHLAYAEMIWFRRRFAGEDVTPIDESDPTGTIDDAILGYRDEWEHSDGIIAAAPSLDAPCARHDEAPVNLRWVIAHMLEETARHAGHADILRELIDGETGR